MPEVEGVGAGSEAPGLPVAKYGFAERAAFAFIASIRFLASAIAALVAELPASLLSAAGEASRLTSGVAVRTGAAAAAGAPEPGLLKAASLAWIFARAAAIASCAD